MSGARNPIDCQRVAELVDRHFGRAGGELLIGGLPIGAIVARHGSPLFVYDEAILLKQWQLLRATLPAGFEIYYSVKANPNQALLKLFIAQGVGFEIASGGELHQALAAGCPAGKIVFAGPGKSEAELAFALEQGIGEIHVESLAEARRIALLARTRRAPVPIALRVNPAAAVEGGSMRMGAKAVPFGIDEDQLAGAVREILTMQELEIVGLHLYVGTQILDAQVLLMQYRAGIAIARELCALIGRPLVTIDLGGGLGVPYFAHETPLDLQVLGHGLSELMAELREERQLANVRYVVEPGRFLVAEAGLYVARVVDVKTSRGKTFVITDGGMHHHLAASGNLGQTIKRNFPVGIVNKLDQAPALTVDIAGPLCTPLDVLARDLSVPAVEIGDLVGVFQSGAYARAASPLGFLSHPSPAEVLVADGVDRNIRRRGRPEDCLADQQVECDERCQDQ